METKVKLCSRCVLPETFPGISFDAQGVCNFCRTAKGEQALVEEKQVYLQKLKDLIAELKGNCDTTTTTVVATAGVDKSNPYRTTTST